MSETTTSETKTRETKIKTLVLSGGGLQGLSFIGCIPELKKSGVELDIKTIVGASAGSVFGLALVLGYDGPEIIKVFSRIGQMFEKITFKNLNLFGIASQSQIKKLIQFMLFRRGLSIKTTLAELYARYEINLVVVVSNLSKSRVEYISHETNPNYKVSSVICASCLVPFLFEKTRLGGDLMVDGSLMDNQPTNPLYLNGKKMISPEGILFLRITEPPEPQREIKSIQDYTLAILNLFRNKKPTGTEWVIDVVVDMKDSFVNFNITPEFIRELIIIGGNSVKKSLEKEKIPINSKFFYCGI